MNESNDKKETLKKMMKKGVSLSLCAVLAGGLAAGAYEGVNQLMGWNQTTVSAASDKVSLLLTSDDEKTEDAEDSGKVKGSLDVTDIVEKAMPSVVSISTISVQEVQDYYGFFGYGGYSVTPREREIQGGGSGIIIGRNDKEMLIATNYHVVESADTVSVSFADGSVYEASVKGFDETKDLAVVAVVLDDVSKDTLKEVSIASIGSSDDLAVGEQVVAIGNALGYGLSVTTGIVSAKNRQMNGRYINSSDQDENSGVNLIQTDAAINPGNSGGALLNMDGEVVGINSAKLASTDVEGMGYAIAISDVKDVLENLMNTVSRDKVADGKHGVLGITGRTVSTEGTQFYGMPEGVFVAEVTEGEGADKAGIKKNYIITSFDNKSVTSIDQLVGYLEYYEPGEEVEVVVQIPDSEGYEEKTVTVTLSENTETDETGEDEDTAKDEADPQDDAGDEAPAPDDEVLDEAPSDESQPDDSQPDEDPGRRGKADDDIPDEWGDVYGSESDDDFFNWFW